MTISESIVPFTRPMKLEVKATWWNVKESKFTFLAISHVGIISFLFQSRKLRDSGCIAFKYYFTEYKAVKDKEYSIKQLVRNADYATTDLFSDGSRFHVRNVCHVTT